MKYSAFMPESGRRGCAEQLVNEGFYTSLRLQTSKTNERHPFRTQIIEHTSSNQTFRQTSNQYRYSLLTSFTPAAIPTPIVIDDAATAGTRYRRMSHNRPGLRIKRYRKQRPPLNVCLCPGNELVRVLRASPLIRGGRIRWRDGSYWGLMPVLPYPT